MDKQSDLVNPKSLEVCGRHANTDVEFEEYTEEEILSEEEPIEEGSSNEESAEEVPCGEKPDDEEDSDEGFEEALEDSEDVSVEEIIEEDISEESEEEPKGKEPLRGSMDQPPLVNDSDVPSLLKEKNASDAIVDFPRCSSKKRRSGWDLKAEDVMLVNDSGDQGKERKNRWSSDVKADSSMLVNDNADHNKRRKTRWSKDEDPSNMPGIPMLTDYLKYSGHFRRLNAKLKLLNQKLDGSVVVNLKPEEPIPYQGRKKKKKTKPKHNFMFKKKLYLPLKEYPSYNFVGLILGPKGNTLKKMEKETGATILLQGKGSILKKKKSPHDHDDLHVMIEADSQGSFDAAVSMVEKLLVPVNDQQNYHKAAQLRELAEIRDSQVDKMYVDKNNPEKQIIPAKLFVGRVPLSVSTDKLKELFQPYGCLCFATVVVDKKTGISKGYGFVKYATYSDAANAIEKMNGYMIDGKQLVVKMAGKANLPNFPGLASIPPTSSNTNQPSFPGLDSIPPNANLPSFPGVDFIPPNANLPSYPGYAVIPPSSSNANKPSCPVLAPVPPSSLSANLPIYPGLASIPSSSSANLPSYPRGAASPSSSNSNLPSYHHFAALSPSSVNANLSTFLKPSLPPSSMTKLQNYPGHVDIPPSSSTAKLPIYSGPAAFPSSSNANLPSYPTPSAVLPSSLNVNLPSFPGFAAIPPPSNANLPSFSGFSAIHPSSNANFLSYPGFSAISQKIPEQNTWPGPPGSLLSESGISFFKSSDNSLAQTGRMPLQSSTSLGMSFQTSTSLGTTVQTSTSLGTTFQTSSLGKNSCTMDGKKLEDTVTGTPPLSLNPNYLNYPGFTAIPREIPEPNRPSAISSELASFPGYLKSLDTSYPFDQSAPSSSLSSRPSYFTREFSGNQINPTLGNYNHTTLN